MRPPIDGGTILITGASSGIGSELARQLAPRARNLVLVARRTGRLEDLRPELEAKNPHLAVYIAACDLADEAATGSMLDRVSERVGAVDVLVNNAGIGDQHLYDKADWARVRRVLQVNILTPALLTHRLVPQMVERGRGGVLNVGSGAGHSFLSGAAAYTGTKHFVDGFTESLRLELL